MYRNFSRIFSTAIVVLAAQAVTFPSSAGAGDFHSWVQFAARGLQARAVAKDGACPSAEVDGRAAEMAMRARPDEAFPVTFCELDLPQGARSAAIGGRALALPPARPNRILVIGDTGCRLKGLFLQDCNLVESWPFRPVAEVASRAAPDLVVHVGDYYYRESPCPILRSGCAGSPHGDVWASWEADFFDPAGPLLRSAPWVFVRGNHENCERGGRGWTRALDPNPFPADGRCPTQDEPFTADLGGLTLVALDVATAEDRVANLEQARAFKAQLQVAGAIEGPVWYAFHKPVFSSVKIAGLETVGDNKTLAEAAREGFPGNVQAILSGHLHTYQAVSYVEDFPAQFVVGNGGDTMDPFAPSKFDGLVINGVTVERGRGAPTKFGYAIFERGESEWRVTDYDLRGEQLLRCSLRGRKLDCD